MSRWLIPVLLAGAWANAACAPTQIVFQRMAVGSQQNDIYIIQEDGSQLITIAASTDNEVACGVTPDHRIVYTRYSAVSADIFLVNMDGTSPTLLVGTSKNEVCKAVTTSGWVIFSNETDATFQDRDLFSVNLATPGQVTTLAATTRDEYFVAMSAANKIIYARKDVDTAPYGQGYSYDAIDADGANPTDLVDASLSPRFVDVTPDDHFVYFASDGQLRSIGTNGSNSVALTAGGASLAAGSNEFCAHTHETISQIVFTNRRSVIINGQTEQQGDTYIVRTDGTGLKALRPSVAHFDDRCVGLVNDDFLVFSRTFDSVIVNGKFFGKTVELHTLSTDGAAVEHTVARVDGQTFKFEGASISGRVVFSTSTSNPFMWTLSSADISGLNPSVLTTNANVGHAVASTVGNRVVYSQWQGLHGDLLAVAASGTSGPIPLAATADEEYLAFVYNRTW